MKSSSCQPGAIRDTSAPACQNHRLDALARALTASTLSLNADARGRLPLPEIPLSPISGQSCPPLSDFGIGPLQGAANG